MRFRPEGFAPLLSARHHTLFPYYPFTEVPRSALPTERGLYFFSISLRTLRRGGAAGRFRAVIQCFFGFEKTFVSVAFYPGALLRSPRRMAPAGLFCNFSFRCNNKTWFFGDKSFTIGIEAGGPTSQSRFARQLPYRGEPLAKRESFPECQGLSSIGEVARRRRDGEVVYSTTRK